MDGVRNPDGLGKQGAIKVSFRERLIKRFQNFVVDPDLFERREANFAARETRLSKREQRISEAETGIYKSDKWANLVIGDYNPDKIGIATYRKMADYDSQVKKGLDILEMGVLSVPWTIEHSDPDVSEFCTWNLNELRNLSISESMREIMSAIWAGFSVTESVWVYEVDQKKFCLRSRRGLKTFDPETIKFYTDEKGKLLKVEESVPGALPINLDLQRTLLYSYGKRFGNYYGESILKASYKNWFIKDNMLKFANIAFERFGAPIMLGVTSSPAKIEDVEDTLSHLWARSVGVLVKKDAKEDPTDIRVLESKRASMPFMEYIDYHDRMILERMLIGETLLRGGGGVYGPKMPYEILKTRLREIQRGVSNALQDLLDLLVHLNFDTKESAIMKFAEIPEQQVKGAADEALKGSVDMS